MAAFPNKQANYTDFVAHVNGYLDLPLQHGHYLDRVSRHFVHGRFKIARPLALSGS